MIRWIMAVIVIVFVLTWGAYEYIDGARLIQTTEAQTLPEAAAAAAAAGESVDELPPLEGSELECLALNVYHESRSEPLIAQIAVASVTLNRVRAERFPSTVCGVVEHSRKAGTCQFSWYCDGKSDTPFEKEAWANSVAVAQFAIDHFNTDFVDGAKYFYSGTTRPTFFRDYETVAVIGNITFLKRPVVE